MAIKRTIGMMAITVILTLGCKAGGESGPGRGDANTGASAGSPATTPESRSPATSSGQSTSAAGEMTLPSGLKYQDLVIGDGAVAETGKKVTVHYTGWLTNGSKFDSSLDRDAPFAFMLGSGQVIRGWEEGVKGMRIGGKRKLTIPPEMGYGARGFGDVIPPNSTLLFEVELLGVQ